MKQARILLQEGCQDPSKLRSSLQTMVDYVAQLKQRCRSLVSKVAALSRLLATSASEQCVNNESTKHNLTRELIGKGYPSNTGSTLRLHRLAVMRSLEAVCGNDQVKQYQVACAVKDLFQQNSTKKERKAVAATEAIMKGLEATFAIIAERSTGETGRGRHKLQDRTICEVLTTALMMALPDNVTINSLKVALGNAVDWRALEAGKRRAEAFKDGTGGAFQPEESTSGGYDPEWEAFVKRCWNDCTRESERKSDERWCSMEKRHNRIRWLEQRLSGILQYIRVAGAAKFGGFTLSWGKMLQLMPRFVRRPGRQTCMCRYHMEFQEFCDALRRWKQSAQKELTPDQAKQCAPAPSSAQEIRQLLQGPKEQGFYKPECCMRHRIKPGCSTCRDKFNPLISDAERAAKPMVTYQKWSDVPYNCKDGRVLTTHDFMSVTVPIAEFEQAFLECISTFLPHHTRAQVADAEWDYLWAHVHEFPKSIGIITDFSNSYGHKHKYEHMQQFWCEVSTTLLGAVMRVRVDNLKDTFMSAGEKAKSKAMLKGQGLPPLITITHAMVSPNPHHDTSVVQHFWKHKLMPWIWEHTQDLEGGNMFVRSDNCGGQFKSARHFRFISEFSNAEHSRGMKMLWSHSEPCHGKDLSDPECGRCKFALEMEEMRHTPDKPTEMKTSWEAFQFLEANCKHLDRDIYQKKGVGIYERVFHFVDQKEVRPLNRLAEVETVTGSDSMHMFYDTGHVRHILTREVACFSCDSCKQMRWRQCTKTNMCGHVVSKDVKVKKQATAPLTATRVVREGMAAATTVQPGMVLGVECASEQRAICYLKVHQPIVSVGR